MLLLIRLLHWATSSDTFWAEIFHTGARVNYTKKELATSFISTMPGTSVRRVSFPTTKMDGVNMTALMGRATKATIRAEVTDRKALSFKPVIEIGEEGRMQSFLYRLQPGYFKNVCTTCHQRSEEGK